MRYFFSERLQRAAYYDVYRHNACEQNPPLVDNYSTWLGMQQEAPEKFQRAVSDGIHPHRGSGPWPAVEALLEEANSRRAGSFDERRRTSCW